MTDMPQVSDNQVSDEDLAAGREGDIPVAGGVLHYRLAGPADAEHVVVFESGWSASLAYAVWLEKALAPHVRILSYDRAGIGDSRSTAPLTPEALTQQLSVLLASLDIRQPVVVAGHSYGGLIAALHAAQAPAIVRALIQIDPTPEISHELIDPSYKILPKLARFMQLCAWLKIDGPIFFHTGKELPPDIFARIKRNPRWLVRSISGSIEEIRLIDRIRPIITASDAAKQSPRLVIGSAPEKLADSWLQKLLMNEEKAKKHWGVIHQLHQQQASLNTASCYMSLPYNHVSLVTNRASAGTIASSILDFIR